LLAGHGDTGHIFDGFAPSLTDHFHVLAITRRGFGASSQPSHGYDLGRLVEDINEITETLHLNHLNLVGHSIAGDEITRFAIKYPAKVNRLVYLEAAYDRVDAQKLESHFPKMPAATSSQRETGTPRDVQAFVARTEILMSESEIRATRVFGSNGQYLRPVTPDPILHSVAVMVEHPDYSAIRAPIMAIYAVYTAPVQLVPRYSTTDRPTQAIMDQIFAMWQPFATGQRALLKERVPHANVVELFGASHYVFISNREQVLRDVNSFLAAQ
jgi:non-heme chloroperoxidase